MKRTKDVPVQVDYYTFLKELQNELEYLQEAKGNYYRQTTAKLALEVATKTRSVQHFFNREDALSTVSKLLDVDDERLKDVSKYLNIILRSLHKKANRTDEYTEDLKKRAKNWRLVLVKPPLLG